MRFRGRVLDAFLHVTTYKTGSVHKQRTVKVKCHASSASLFADAMAASPHIKTKTKTVSRTERLLKDMVMEA